LKIDGHLVRYLHGERGVYLARRDLLRELFRMTKNKPDIECRILRFQANPNFYWSISLNPHQHGV